MQEARHPNVQTHDKLHRWLPIAGPGMCQGGLFSESRRARAQINNNLERAVDMARTVGQRRKIQFGFFHAPLVWALIERRALLGTCLKLRRTRAIMVLSRGLDMVWTSLWTGKFSQCPGGNGSVHSFAKNWQREEPILTDI